MRLVSVVNYIHHVSRKVLNLGKRCLNPSWISLWHVFMLQEVLNISKLSQATFRLFLLNFVLHIISQSPVEAAILERTESGDSVLFIENAVLCLLKQGPVEEVTCRIQHRLHLFALSSDLEVRGVSHEELMPDIQVVDYSGFVELAVENKVNQSWC